MNQCNFENDLARTIFHFVSWVLSLHELKSNQSDEQVPEPTSFIQTYYYHEKKLEMPNIHNRNEKRNGDDTLNLFGKLQFLVNQSTMYVRDDGLVCFDGVTGAVLPYIIIKENGDIFHPLEIQLDQYKYKNDEMVSSFLNFSKQLHNELASCPIIPISVLSFLIVNDDSDQASEIECNILSKKLRLVKKFPYEKKILPSIFNETNEEDIRDFLIVCE